MALTKKELIRELKHQINSPLAAIRNALYLAAVVPMILKLSAISNWLMMRSPASPWCCVKPIN